MNQNRYNIESIGFIGAWPKEFDKFFTVDYETSFRKFFLSVFESMFAVLGWIKKGEEIPLVARIICVADSYDAMATDRAYRKALSKEVILAELEKNKGIQFDPKIAEIMIELIKEGKI